MTSSHRYCSHDDFQSSQLVPRWSNLCADCQSLLLFPWWLPVITTNTTGEIPCEEPISMQWLAVTSHSCWLEVIGLLTHVRIQILYPGPCRQCQSSGYQLSNTCARLFLNCTQNSCWMALPISNFCWIVLAEKQINIVEVCTVDGVQLVVVLCIN